MSKGKKTASRIAALITALSLIAVMIFSGAGIVLRSSAATSSTIGTNNYSTTNTAKASLTKGTTYTFGGTTWVAAEVFTNYAVLQADTAVTAEAHPAYLNKDYGTDYSYTNISSLYTKTKTLYSSISAYEYTSATKGSGLYLISKAACTGYYLTALETAAANAAHGVSDGFAWLGTCYGDDYYCWAVSSSGSFDYYYGGNNGGDFAVAPAFNLDLSKVTVSGTTISAAAAFTASTGITATQSITSVNEGATTALGSIITAVTYTGGTNAGKSAAFTVSISDTGCGTISGTNWTAPSGLTADKDVTLTITDTQLKKTTTKTVKVKASSTGINATAKTASVVEGSTTSFSNLLTVTYSGGTNSGNAVSAYSVAIKSGGGSISGTNYTAPASTSASNQTVVLTVTETAKKFTKDVSITVTPKATGINASAKKTIVEGSTTSLSDLLSVTYSGGTTNGTAVSAYTVTVKSGGGSISGTNYTAPDNTGSSNTTVTLTVKETSKSLTKDVTVTVTPRAAKSIAVEKTSSFPASVTVGDCIDFSKYITVTGYDAGSKSDGVITDYSIAVSDGGTVSGRVYTPATTSVAKEVTVTVTPNGNLGSVNYSGTSATFTVNVKPGITDWTERDEYTDELGFHSYKDPQTGITWKFRYDNDGYILYLYTEDNIQNIISNGNVLIVPSAINGVPVVGIGGGSKDGSTIPFIPVTGDNVNNTWTSIYIPASVKIINDGAFYQSTASASIVIPGTVNEVGVEAFKESKISSVIFNDADSIILDSEAFADISTLKSVTIRGNGLSLHQRVFADDTALTQIEIPYGTNFVGSAGQNDSYAFKGTTGLEVIKIDTETVPSNLFSENKNLQKVIFGENVQTVKYDWSGTNASNSTTAAATVARTTYVLNGDTVFEMDKTSGGSPFGYANALTVVGKARSTDGDSNAYNNTGDPVTAIVAYLAQYYQTNTEVKGYAQGTGTSITITAEDAPAENDGVTSTLEKNQTGIEAYYAGTIFNGKSLVKGKMSVYKMFGDKQNGSYEPDDFYVIRTAEADELLAVDNTNEKHGDSDVYVATYSDSVVDLFAAKDSVKITDDDVKYGTVEVTVIVLQKDDDGNVIVDHSNGHVKAFTAVTSIPVKEYSAEEDFLETYGSYTAVIEEIDALNAQVDELTLNVTNKEAEIKELTDDKEGLEEQVGQMTSDIAGYQEEIADLKGTYTVLAEALSVYKADGNRYAAEEIDDDAMEEIKEAVNAAVTSLNEVSEKLNELDGAVSNLYNEMITAMTSMGLDTSGLKLDDEDMSAADKISAIGTMVAGVTSSYNDLTLQYTALEGKYNAIVEYVYGAEPDGEVSVSDIENKIASNQTKVTEAAVADALTKAAEADNTAETVQKDIGATITAILAGETVSTDELPDELKAALTDVQEMQSNVTAMQGKISGFETELSGIKTALGLSDTATSAQVLAAIQSLNTSIKSLQTENASLKTTNSALQTENTSLKNENTALKSDTTSGSAGTVTTTPVTSTTTTTTPVTSTSGDNTSELKSQITSLKSQVASLTAVNNTLSSQISDLEDSNDELSSQISSLESSNDRLNSKLTSATDTVNSLSEQMDELNAQQEASSSVEETVPAAAVVIVDDTPAVETAEEDTSSEETASVIIAEDNGITGTDYETENASLPQNALSFPESAASDSASVDFKGNGKTSEGTDTPEAAVQPAVSSSGMTAAQKAALTAVGAVGGVAAVGGGTFALAKTGKLPGRRGRGNSSSGDDLDADVDEYDSGDCDSNDDLDEEDSDDNDEDFDF